MNLKRLIFLAMLIGASSALAITIFAKSRSHTHDLSAIEKLHQQDIAATLAGDPQALAKLWADDAVRLEPGAAEVGKGIIVEHDTETMKSNGEMRILSYAPEIRDVKIVDGWAFEWGFFSSSYRDHPNSPVKTFRGKLLRVLERQRDGSWKFARVMWNLAE